VAAFGHGRGAIGERIRDNNAKCGRNSRSLHNKLWRWAEPRAGTQTRIISAEYDMLDLNPKPTDLDAIETASRDEITALQLTRMKWSLRHAYDNVAHYRAAFDAAGVHPDDLQTIADLAKFPFTAKQDLRANYPFGMFAVPRDQVSRIHASSGTTGQPTVVGYTKNDLAMWGDVIARSLRAAGLRRGDMLHNAYGYGLFTGGLGIHGGAEAMGLTVVPVSGGQTQRQVRLIEDFGAKGITVTPSYMLSILDEYRAQDRDPQQSSLEVGIFGAEPWTNAMRVGIEAAFNIHALDIYGLSEVIGPGVSMECVESKDGLHIWEDHFYPEIIDPQTGAVLPDGEFGELVFTSLSKEAFPIIRYRTRDLTRLLPGTARSMRRMEKVTGRSDDMMILRGVNVFPTQIEEQLLATTGLAPHFQIELTRLGRMDELIVHTEALLAFARDEHRTDLSTALAARIKAAIGISVRVRTAAPGAIPRSEGKAVRIIDNRPKG
jgi:phenylacetate-CoA ligase